VSELYEDQIIEFEAAMVDAQERWFKARDHIDRDILNERIFEGGFRMAWNTRAQPKQPSDEELFRIAQKNKISTAHLESIIRDLRSTR
jgi:hypothetical protein